MTPPGLRACHALVTPTSYARHDPPSRAEPETAAGKVVYNAARRGLALDLDGTLMDSMDFHAEAWRQAFAAYGLNAPVEWFYLWEGIIGPEVVPMALERLGAALAPGDADGVYRQKQAYFNAAFRPQAMPGADMLRRTLDSLGYATAVVTGSEHATAVRMLAAVNFDNVTTVVGSDDVRRGKPAPDPYLLAAERLGTPPAHMLALENAPEGIKSARAAGMLCVAVATTLSPADLRAADHIVPDLPAFAALLEAERARSGGAGPWLLDG